MKQKDIIKYIQVLSVISSFAVVVLHVNGAFWKFSYDRYWLTANIMECVFYFAVPVFFMISGVTLMDYREKYSTKEFFIKRVKKTVIPFIFWSLFGVVYTVLKSGTPLGSPLDILFGIANNKYMYVYWFFFALFAVYLSIPLLSAIPKTMRKKCFGYAIVCFFVLNSALPLISDLLGYQYNADLSFPVCIGYVVYALIGYYLHNYELQKKYRIIIYSLSVLGLLSHIVFTKILSYANGTVMYTFKGYLNVPSILYSTGIFLFVKNIQSTKFFKFFALITKPFQKLSFGIYLIHYYIYLEFLSIFSVSETSIIFRTLGAVAVFLISAVLVRIIQLIPILKKTIPS